MSAQIAEMVEILGLSHKPQDSYLHIADEMEQGLPARALDRLARHIAPNDATFKYRVVPKATLARIKGKRLSPAQSERLGRYARVWAAALRVWKSEEGARDFLWGRHMLLDGRRPIDVAATEVGARLVEEILGGLEFGTAV